MPKLKNRPPRLCKDKAYAVVYCNGTRLPMGKWKTPEAEKNYRRFLAEWAACPPSAAFRPGKKILIEEVLAAYLDWAETNIDKRVYHPTQTVVSFVLDLYAGTPVDEFGCKSLAIVQETLEKTGRFSRNYINEKLIGRLRTMLRWGVAQEMVSIATVDALKCVPPLRKGHTTAHESKPRDEVPDEVVDATLPFMKPVVAAMVQIQRWAVMRPNEPCRMRVGDIDKSRSDGIWLYRVPNHKGTWLDHDKIVPLGKPEPEVIEDITDRKIFAI
jgi:hypothetical protein